jgi:hypothetical protein
MRFFATLVALVALAPVAHAQGFPTPTPATGSPWDGLNLLLTRQRLLDIQAAVSRGDPVATQAVAQVISDATSYLNQTPNPIQGVLKVPGYYTSQQAVQQQITAQIRGDGRAALALAWGYALSGQQSFADASKSFIFAWVQNLTTPEDGLDESGFAGVLAQRLERAPGRRAQHAPLPGARPARRGQGPRASPARPRGSHVLRALPGPARPEPGARPSAAPHRPLRLLLARDGPPRPRRDGGRSRHRREPRRGWPRVVGEPGRTCRLAHPHDRGSPR